MKNRFPAGYCPRHEKIVDLSRAVLSGNRRYARHRRTAGRRTHKVARQGVREALRAAVTMTCECGGDPEIDCGRCHADSLPTRSETVAGGTRHSLRHPYLIFHGPADHLGPLYNWFENRTAGMTWTEIEDFLRASFLASPHGNSLQTRHAYDHLMFTVRHQLRLFLNGS